MTMASIRNAGRPHPILTATNMGTIMFPKLPESKGVNLSLTGQHDGSRHNQA